MNNYIYPIPKNSQQVIIEELKKINDTLIKIEKKINKKDNTKTSDYLENDNNYYMI